MNADEYLQGRVDDQIAWYSRKSGTNQAWYKRLRVGEIVAAASIPILAPRSSDAQPAWMLTVAILGGLIAVIAAILGLYQFEQTWIDYRSTAESLKKEKFLFLTQAEPYDGDDAANFRLLVQRVESLVSKENTNWAQYVARPKEAGQPT